MAVTNSNTLSRMLALAAAGVFYYVFNYGVAFAMEKCEKAFTYYN